MIHKMGRDCMESRRRFLKAVGVGSGAAILLPGVGASAPKDDFPSLPQLRAAHEKQGIVLPEKTYRMMEWEFHTPPQEDFNINWDAALKAARDAGAESMMFYSQDHWGYAFYPSDVAVRHPHLQGDMFGTEVSLARKLGMSVVCYYSLQFNTQSVLRHPDWGWVNEKGEQQKLRWYIACLDSPYRQYVLGMMDEIFSRYEVDELFLDIFGIQPALFHYDSRDPFCFCRYTEEAWNKDHPGDPYREGFQTREGWERRYQWLQKRSLIDMLDEIIAIARKHRPNVIVSLNGGPESFPDEIMQRVSYIYAEPLPCPTGIALGSILMRGWGRPYYQAGIFTQQGYLDMYPGSIPRVQADALIVQNARTLFAGNAPIVSGLDGQGFSKRWFAVAKETWEDVRNVDSLLQGVEPLCSTGMLYSGSTGKELDAQKRPTDFRRSNLGALETLTYAGRPVESFPEFRLTREDLKKFEALVLPEVEVLSDSQADVIRQWVKEGGALVASYRCGLLDEGLRPRSNFPLADVFGVDFVSEERKYATDAEGKVKEGITSTYLESSGHPLAKILAVSTVGLPGPFLELKRTTSEEVMHYRLPFMVEDLPHHQWFNWGPPPPGSETAGPAVTYNRFGKGQAVYIGVPLFRAMDGRPVWIQRWVPELMRQLVPRPIAELRPEPFSEYVHGTFFWDAGKKFILVQALNTLELVTGGEFRPAGKIVIRTDPARLKVVGARIVWPKEQELEVLTKGGFRHVEVAAPGRYTALYLKVE
jgi:hypothetical protein